MVYAFDWQQIIAWAALAFVLYSMITERFHYSLAAFASLLFLGLVGVSEPKTLYSGFSSPALFTVAIVLVMSAGIVESGVFFGLGKRIAKRIHSPAKQILAIAGATSILSAFMNNVGAIGIMLPTAKRMSARAGWDSADFGMPLAYASILGGSVTLIGTASNLIVSTYRFQAFGRPFRMFDFAAHGLTLVLVGMLILVFCRLFGWNAHSSKATEKTQSQKMYEVVLADTETTPILKGKLIVISTLISAVLLAASGIVHPSVGFGVIVLFWIVLKILSVPNALNNMNVPVILFLGSMLSISAVLESTGALQSAVAFILPLVISLPPFLLILMVLFTTAFFANIMDNSVGAVIMSPLVIQLYQSGGVDVNVDALLMAVAAGASLGVVLPTHQAAIVAMESTNFSKRSYMRSGALIALFSGVSAAAVINSFWI
ncbi:MAG: hypothetical protein EOM59_04475 [Clostridia bacterium]|nr:hypothetical protein [Clostridia bacterium]